MNQWKAMKSPFRSQNRTQFPITIQKCGKPVSDLCSWGQKKNGRGRVEKALAKFQLVCVHECGKCLQYLQHSKSVNYHFQPERGKQSDVTWVLWLWRNFHLPLYTGRPQHITKTIVRNCICRCSVALNHGSLLESNVVSNGRTLWILFMLNCTPHPNMCCHNVFGEPIFSPDIALSINVAFFPFARCVCCVWACEVEFLEFFTTENAKLE